MNLYKVGKYKNAKCECGIRFYQSSCWINSKKCICNKCGRDVTKRIQEKYKIVKDCLGNLIIK